MVHQQKIKQKLDLDLMDYPKAYGIISHPTTVEISPANPPFFFK